MKLTLVELNKYGRSDRETEVDINPQAIVKISKPSEFCFLISARSKIEFMGGRSKFFKETPDDIQAKIRESTLSRNR